MLNETVHCMFIVPFQSDFVGCDVGFVWGASLAHSSNRSYSPPRQKVAEHLA